MSDTPQRIFPDKRFTVRVRGIIMHEGKIFLVRHSPKVDFYVLPGGKIERGEGIEDCLRRELIEELGVEPQVGRLLYVHMFETENKAQHLDFFFEVKNGFDYLNIWKNERTHEYEIYAAKWVAREDDIKIMPQKIGDDFRAGTLLADSVRFIR